ncbi:MAG TPA: hypothetical protein VFS33_01045 [Gemmatimonadales bacterium]|nr:hypothetical protein [Gemmatimonadales bacterium]
MTKKKHNASDKADDRRESGAPGGGQGRRDEVGGSGVYSRSADNIPGDAVIRTPQQWGQGNRGAEGYGDSGGSELVWRNGVLLGGLTSDPSGRPSIDIHGVDRPQLPGSTESPGKSQEGSTKRSTGKRSSKSDDREWGRGTYGPGAGGERMVERHEHHRHPRH